MTQHITAADTATPSGKLRGSIQAGIPKARLARQIGITREKLYSFLDPPKFWQHYRPSAEDFAKIAEATRFSLKRVIADYEERLGRPSAGRVA